MTIAAISGPDTTPPAVRRRRCQTLTETFFKTSSISTLRQVKERLYWDLFNSSQATGSSIRCPNEAVIQDREPAPFTPPKWAKIMATWWINSGSWQSLRRPVEYSCGRVAVKLIRFVSTTRCCAKHAGGNAGVTEIAFRRLILSVVRSLPHQQQ